MNKYFFSCDWGTSSFRLRLVDIATGEIINHLVSAQGIAATYAQWKATGREEKDRISFYLSVLLTHIQQISADAGIGAKNIPVIISGMASSSIGMLELAYTSMPFSLEGKDLELTGIKETPAFPYDILLVSGATNGTDVMRGEETQLIGCGNKNFAGTQVFIFPGTHSKHITTTAGKATNVETYMTGEFFELLSKKSILSDSVEAGGDIDIAENKTSFENGVRESAGQNLLHSSFMVRTNQLFKKCSKTANYFYLSGLLIGAELNQLLKNKTNSITIAGDKKLQSNYTLALQLLKPGANLEITDDITATVQGHLVIYKNMTGI